MVIVESVNGLGLKRRSRIGPRDARWGAAVVLLGKAASAR